MVAKHAKKVLDGIEKSSSSKIIDGSKTIHDPYGISLMSSSSKIIDGSKTKGGERIMRKTVIF